MAVFACPSDARNPGACTYFGNGSRGADKINSYNYNCQLGGYDLPGSDQARSLAQIKTPTKVIFLADGAYPVENYWNLCYAIYGPGFYDGAYTHTRRHNGGENVAFVDGHSKWYRLTPGLYAADTDVANDISFLWNY